MQQLSSNEKISSLGIYLAPHPYPWRSCYIRVSPQWKDVSLRLLNSAEFIAVGEKY